VDIYTGHPQTFKEDMIDRHMLPDILLDPRIPNDEWKFDTEDICNNSALTTPCTCRSPDDHSLASVR